jgi:hypothetical protein
LKAAAPMQAETEPAGEFTRPPTFDCFVI